METKFNQVWSKDKRNVDSATDYHLLKGADWGLTWCVAKPSSNKATLATQIRLIFAVMNIYWLRAERDETRCWMNNNDPDHARAIATNNNKREGNAIGLCTEKERHRRKEKSGVSRLEEEADCWCRCTHN